MHQQDIRVLFGLITLTAGLFSGMDQTYPQSSFQCVRKIGSNLARLGFHLAITGAEYNSTA